MPVAWDEVELSCALGENNGVKLYQVTLTDGEDSDPIALPDHTERTVQINGTIGTTIIEGSLDNTNYVTLTDVAGNALSFTADSLATITEATRTVRARNTAGAGVSALVTIMLKGCRG